MSKLLLICLLIPIVSFNQELTPPLDLRFGMTKDVVTKKMKRVKTGEMVQEKETIAYSAVKMGNKMAEGIKLDFYKNKLARVFLLFEKTNIDDFSKIFIEKYGQPKKTTNKNNRKRQEWITNGKTITLMELGDISNEGQSISIAYWDNAMNIQIVENDKKVTRSKF